jgi:hypothetical protein
MMSSWDERNWECRVMLGEEVSYEVRASGIAPRGSRAASD